MQTKLDDMAKDACITLNKKAITYIKKALSDEILVGLPGDILRSFPHPDADIVVSDSLLDRGAKNERGTRAIRPSPAIRALVIPRTGRGVE